MAASNEVAIDLRARNMATRELDAASAALQGLGKDIQGASFLAKSASQVWAGAMMHIGESVKNFVFKGFSLAADSIIGFNSRVEQAMIGFTTMLGSAAKAQGFMEELQQFAASTPFEFDGLRQSANLIMAMGFEAKEVIPLLTAAGDAVAALGLGTEAVQRVVYALGQMRAAGRVTGQDMMQLSAMGIPAWKMLADSMQLTVAETKKMAEQGAIDAETAIKAITTAIETGNMGGMMAAQARTFNGAVSTIKDTIQIVVSQAFKPLFDVVSKTTVGIADFLGSEGFLDWADDARGAISGVIGEVLELGESMGPLVEQMLPALASLFGVLLDIGGRTFTVMTMALSGVIGILTPLLPLLTGFIPPLVTMLTLWKGITLATGAFTAVLALQNATMAVTATVWSAASGIMGAPFNAKMLLSAAGLKAFGSALMLAMGPVGWAVAGITALGVAATAMGVDFGAELDELALDFGELDEMVHGLVDSTGQTEDAVEDAIMALRELGIGVEDAGYIVERFGEDAARMGDDVVQVMDDLKVGAREATDLVALWGDKWRSNTEEVTKAVQTTGISWDTMQAQMADAYGFLSATDQMNMMLAAAEKGPEAWQALMDGNEAVQEDVKATGDAFAAAEQTIRESGQAWVQSVEETVDGIAITLTNGEVITTASMETLGGKMTAAIERAEADLIEVMARTPGTMSQAIIDNSDAFNTGLQLLIDMVEGTVDTIITTEEAANATRLANAILANSNSTAAEKLHAWEMLNQVKAASLERIAVAQAEGTDTPRAYADAIAMNNWLINESGMDINAINEATWAEALRLAGEAGADDPAEYAAAMRAAGYLAGDAGGQVVQNVIDAMNLKKPDIVRGGHGSVRSYIQGVRDIDGELGRAIGNTASTVRTKLTIDVSSGGRSVINSWMNGMSAAWNARYAELVGMSSEARNVLGGSLPTVGPLKGGVASGGFSIIESWFDGMIRAGDRNMGDLERLVGGVGNAFGMNPTGDFPGFGITPMAFDSPAAARGVTIVNHFGAGSVRSDDDIHAISQKLAMQIRMETL